MLLAELTIRHTRRTMATRRVTVASSYLPTAGRAPGVLLATAILREFLPWMTEDQVDALPAFVEAARRGLEIPQVAMRYRLQTDDHGLDRSRHRLIEIGPEQKEDPALRWVLELDVHAAPDPQVIGLVMAAATLEATPRRILLETVLAVHRDPSGRRHALPPDVIVRRLREAPRRARPGAPGAATTDARADGSAPRAPTGRWAAMTSEERWALGVLSVPGDEALTRPVVQRRFRVLVRSVHPDHGAPRTDAATRIAELTEARDLLLRALDASTARTV